MILDPYLILEKLAAASIPWPKPQAPAETNARQPQMISCRLWLVPAGLLMAAMPAMAQEVILQVPERRPPPAATLDPQPAETPPPDNKPDKTPHSGASAESVVVPDADTSPEASERPQSVTSESTASEDAAAGVDNAAVETAGPPPVPARKPLPGDRPTMAWKSPKVAAERERCTKLLKGLILDYETLQPIRRGACGAPAPILVKSIGADLPVAIEPPATMRCGLAVALDTWLNDQVQPAALEAFGSPVAKIRTLSSYKCRNRYNAANAKISEHAFANALDISEFELASGKRVTVLKGWPRTKQASAPPTPEPKPDGEADALTKISAESNEPPSPPPGAPVHRSSHGLTQTDQPDVLCRISHK